MASVDVREESGGTVDKIIFADNYDGDILIAHSIRPEDEHYGVGERKAIRICDNTSYVIINSEYHARHLIRALEKAIGLGWVE